MNLPARRLYGVSRRLGPRQAEDLVTCVDELRNDR
jgi:hypothetical protein